MQALCGKRGQARNCDLLRDTWHREWRVGIIFLLLKLTHIKFEAANFRIKSKVTSS